MNLDFNVERIEYVVNRRYPAGRGCKIFSKETHRLVYIISGSANMIFADRTIGVSEGDVIFLSPKDNYEAQTTGEVDYTFITIAFDLDNIQKMPILKLRAKDSGEFFLSAYDMYNSGAPIWSVYLKMTIYTLLYKLLSSPEHTSPISSGIELVISYIMQNYKRKLSLDRLVALSGYSKTHFKRLFLKKTGCSPIKYLNAVRISKAKNMLKSNLFSIGEVALSVGIENVYYFSTVFKKLTSLSPSEYIAKSIENKN
jgi:YesN/AraC family two-component response regulator